MKEDQHIYKSHNKTLLLYHLVFPAKYRKKIFDDKVDKTLKEICLEISDRYEIHFVEIGNDIDHVHFLVQSVPTLSVTRIVTIIKSITAREIFLQHQDLKKILWGGNLWTSGFYGNTVGQYSNQEVIKKYIQNQGKDEKEYTKLYQGELNLD
jgi:REP element-mobilizing transposase RayT